MSPPPVWVEPSCPDPVPNGDATATGGIPGDFETSWVLRCHSDVRDVPGDGRWLMDIAERADTSAPELLDQLRRESDPQSGGPCHAILVVPPYFALVDPAGRALLPMIPTDQCGSPRQQALDALAALPFQVLSETPVKQVESQQAIDSGCSESWKDQLTIEAGGATPGPATPLWPAPVDVLHVCVYDTDPGADEPVGQFNSGRTLAGNAATALSDAINRAGPAIDCPTPHSQFAVITLNNTDQWAVAGLDGCHHLLRPNNTLGQLDKRTIALLLG